MSDKFQEAFAKTRIAGSVASGALDELSKFIEPGISTNKIDNLCYEFINDNGAFSAPLFYRGFPKTCCTSANHIVCHGIPSDKILREGDIINVDVTAFKDGWHGDTSRMFYVGEVSVRAKKLVETTYEAMMKGIEVLTLNSHLGNIGEAIQNYVEKKGFSVVRDFCGHGIGEVFHKEPNVLHYGIKDVGKKLEVGMIFTIEPMINEGVYETKVLNDGWTAVTKDKKLSAQFEHTIGITNDGYEIFTASKKGLNFPPYK
ncbi:MAG: type I methionyl aminopeptidase [Pelagibacterales bacterium MED-G40]|nr:MAG: type I methionyl aminopeptidase [Candidatus Pelagibacter sp. TMED203]PDH19374.1 MAG: type I methionyl aminopeptidase [Pelagibacterales bacterium MED-G40]|tara:strand:- start:1247 stop:2020 length:774 start_codon:yes stop_codon:yes gene_type:complete